MYLHVFHREQEWCSGGSTHSHQMWLHILNRRDNVMFELILLLVLFLSSRGFFLYLLPFSSFLKTNNSKIQLHQGNGRYKEPQTLYVYLLPSKSLFYLFICYLFAVIHHILQVLQWHKDLLHLVLQDFCMLTSKRSQKMVRQSNTLPSPVDIFFGFI